MQKMTMISHQDLCLITEDSTFEYRTFDVLWVDRTALMYKDGINKVRQFAQFKFYLSKMSRLLEMFDALFLYGRYLIKRLARQGQR